MRSINKKNAVNFIFANLVAIATSIYIFRNYFLNKIFIGEPFDTRLVVTLHEHWYRFLSGDHSFLDAQIFFPFSRSFSLTETFLLSGLFHSVLRELGLSILDAWLITNIILVYVGLIGWYFLATKIFEKRFFQFLSILLIGTSYAFMAHINERPTAVSFLLISWSIYFLILFLDETSKKITSSVYLGLIITIIPLITLNSWYAGFFLVVIMVITLFIIFSTPNSLKKVLFSKLKNLNVLIFAFFLFFASILTALWAWIYLPTLSQVSDEARPLSELINNSPNIQDIFNNESLGGSLLLLESLKIENSFGERSIGLGFALIFLFLASLAYLLSNIRMLSNIRLLIILVTISVIIIQFSVIKFSDKSAFIFMWDQLSFLKSIRFPSRITIYTNFFAILIILIALEMLTKKINFFPKIAIISLVSIFLILNQQRNAPGMWSEADLYDKSLARYQDSLNLCDTFILDRPKYGYWKDFIEAIPLTMLYRIPTINGYSGSYPKGYPSINWYSDGDIGSLAKWTFEQNSDLQICIIDGLNSKPLLLQSHSYAIVKGSAFTGDETNGVNNWNWAVEPDAEIYIYNLESIDKNLILNFAITFPSCLANSSLAIEHSSDSIKIESRKKNFNLKTLLRIQPWSREVIKFSTNTGPCRVGDDPRELYFSLKDLRINDKRATTN